ncbi:hypothetical protein QP563_15105 [Escherichia coli]|uniref:hypothetical protein n=1 Tax=Escherichia coli TaxID=562 RepID=UPI0020234B73|nr:hypothetical protein [Escherichia coli]MDK7639553.1 hypothetical protein [Escherichia coli]MDK7713823.1 hypothetical protein [Escherichia coli]
MEKKLPACLLTSKHTSVKRKQNEETAKAFYLLTRIAANKPGDRIIYLSFHRAKIVALKEGIHITPARFYRAINELIDTNTIARAEFKYQYILNPVYFSFLKADPT